MIAMVESAKRQKTKDTERDRADHRAGRAHDSLPWRNRVLAAVLTTQCRGRWRWPAGQHHRAGSAPGVPDPHHHCRPVVGHRRRGRGLSATAALVALGRKLAWVCFAHEKWN